VRSIRAGIEAFFPIPIPTRYRRYRPIPSTRCRYRSHPSSKCPPLARTQVRRRTLHQLHYEVHSVEGRAKCPTVPKLSGLMIGTRIAGQGSNKQA